MPLPLLRTEQPRSAAEAAALIKAAAAERTPVFPLGGETALDCGLQPRVPGVGLSLGQLDQLVDYPARDMTVTVGAGMKIEKLRQLLAAEAQELPLDVAQAEQATIGGCIAANISGYRRLGNGTLRDYVIGIEAVDGHGTIYHGGGRVVKNVAGYDFCRLLIGAQGTLGVITQVTIKVKPLAPRSAVLLQPISDLTAADRCVETVLQAPQLPSGLELFNKLPDSLVNLSETNNSPDRLWLAVILQGTDSEVNAQLNSHCHELARIDAVPVVLHGEQSTSLLMHLREFPALIVAGGSESLAVKIHFQPSRLLAGLRWLTSLQPGVVWQAHAGTGIVYALLPQQPTSLGQWLLQTGHPEVQRLGGRLQIWRVPEAADLTTTALWGPAGDAMELNRAIRTQFDPRGILNAGRFWS